MESYPSRESNQPDESFDEFEIDYLKQTPEHSPKRSAYARIGGAALAVALVASVAATKLKSVEAANQDVKTEVDSDNTFSAPNVFSKVVENPIVFTDDSTTPTIVINDSSAPVTPSNPPVVVPAEVPATPTVETPVITPTAETPVTPPTAETPVIPPMVEVSVTPPTAETPVTPPTAETPVIPPTVETPVIPMAEVPVAPVAAPVDPAANVAAPIPAWNGEVLNRVRGIIDGPSGEETFYNLPMDKVIRNMRSLGNNDQYWVREDGAKMLGPYIIVAANLDVHPRGTLVQTSLGIGLVCDTGTFAEKHPTRIDIATNW